MLNSECRETCLEQGDAINVRLSAVWGATGQRPQKEQPNTCLDERVYGIRNAQMLCVLQFPATKILLFFARPASLP